MRYFLNSLKAFFSIVPTEVVLENFRTVKNFFHKERNPELKHNIDS